MERIKNNWHSWLNTSVQLITIGALVFWGGGLWQMVNAHETRISNLEGKGTPQLRAHESMDDERIGSLKQRVTNLEIVFSTISDMRGDLRVISTKLDKMAEELKGHVQDMRGVKDNP